MYRDNGILPNSPQWRKDRSHQLKKGQRSPRRGFTRQTDERTNTPAGGIPYNIRFLIFGPTMSVTASCHVHMLSSFSQLPEKKLILRKLNSLGSASRLIGSCRNGYREGLTTANGPMGAHANVTQGCSNRSSGIGPGTGNIENHCIHRIIILYKRSQCAHVGTAGRTILFCRLCIIR